MRDEFPKLQNSDRFGRMKSLLLVYLVPALATALLAVVLWRRKDAPALGYLCFTAAAGVVSLLLMVDTGWLARVPRFQVGSDIYGVVTNIIALGYKTEMFSREKLQREVRFESVPEDPVWKSRLPFTLTEPAVPDSVTVWENDLPMAPNRITVEGREVRVKLSTAADPRTSESEYPYIIRYFSSTSTPVQVMREGPGGAE